MANKTVVFHPNVILSTKCKSVITFDDKLQELIGDLRDTAKQHNAEGLAAPQIGEAVRVFVVHVAEDYHVYVNPQILSSAGSLSAHEGCLSFPNVYGRVERAEMIRVSYQAYDGDVLEETLTGARAVAFQHELDHLDGVVFTDRMGKLEKHLATKKHQKVQRRIEKSTKKMQEMLNKLGNNNVVIGG